MPAHDGRTFALGNSEFGNATQIIEHYAPRSERPERLTSEPLHDSHGFGLGGRYS